MDSDPPEWVSPVWQQQKKRTKAAVEHELAEATERRKHATTVLDFDAHDALTRQIDDLLLELVALLPTQREGT